MNAVGEKRSRLKSKYQKTEYYLQSFDINYELQHISPNGMFLKTLETLSPLIKNRFVPKYSSSPVPFFPTQPPAGLKSESKCPEMLYGLWFPFTVEEQQ